MNQAVQLHTDRCLLLFDIHEDSQWVRRVLAREEGRFTHLVLGGDYFDTHVRPAGGGVGATFDLLLELRERFQDQLTILLGNHDLCYASSTDRGLRLPRRLREDIPLYCSGYSRNKAARIRHVLGERFWAEVRLFQVVNGWFVSHAGLLPHLWPENPTVDAALEQLDKDCRAALATCARHESPLLAAGLSRGGEFDFGGLTWADFDAEFTDGLPMPQIMGHTTHSKPTQNGRSWALGCGQTYYGVLDGTGTLTFENAAEES